MNLLAESTALGLDSTWWTALGTLTALLIALCGAILPSIRKRINRPELSISYDRVAEFSSPNEQQHWIRVPITNAEGKDEAKNVEVFIERFSESSSSRLNPIEGTVPMRLMWCHSHQPICSSIPAGGFRLLHLGSVDLKPRMKTVENVLHTDFPKFTLGGEVWVPAHAPIASGTFCLTVSVSTDGLVLSRHKIRISLSPGSKTAPPVKVDKMPSARDWMGNPM